MDRFRRLFAASAMTVVLLFGLLQQQVRSEESVFVLDNGVLRCAVTVRDGRLVGDTYTLNPAWASRQGGVAVTFKTSADFALDFMWTAWRPPGKVNNAENPAVLTSKDFTLVQATNDSNGQVRRLNLDFRGPGHLVLRLTYTLQPGAFFCRRQIVVRDTVFGKHFLRWTWPLRGTLPEGINLLKAGGFGQPVAFTIQDGGVFLGLEFPTANNEVSAGQFRCGQEIGEKVGRLGVASDPVVVALTPDNRVRLWFDRYLDSIRVAPLKPYLLYNSWYDLRAPVMVKDPARALTETNVLRTISILRDRLVDKRKVHFDAFVLDDGWDVYRSDWQINRDQFPNGFAPLVRALSEMGTHLGIWIGPIGGYSHRDWRVTWMRNHGYETVGDQMCVAGKRYGKLLLKRVTDLVRQDSVRYFKWDGIQFSCSEPGHGHLPGIYSRRAVMERVIDMCRSVRAISPDVFTNITSGTWLSPWWLKYTNTIWMQGRDYGYAKVASISRRDQAMTYRDLVLYRDFVTQNQWFPVANLMTHGIIKGYLNMLGGRQEPLDKFTDNAVLYVARGPAMWELYISPGLLTNAELDALAGAIHWAKNRFSILAHTRLIGGNPGEGEPYAYLHFLGERGIIAVRNPVVAPQSLAIRLTSEYGLKRGADSLVVEKVYPAGFVFPRLYRDGDAVNVDLNGFETAIYEVYPVSEARKPLLGGVEYCDFQVGPKAAVYRVYAAGTDVRLLNRKEVSGVQVDGKAVAPGSVALGTLQPRAVVSAYELRAKSGRKRARVTVRATLSDSWQSGELAFLLNPDDKHSGGEDPVLVAKLDGRRVEPNVQHLKGYWRWVKIPVEPGAHKVELDLKPGGKGAEWSGKVQAWLVGFQKVEPVEVKLVSSGSGWKRDPMPPQPWPPGTRKVSLKLGESGLSVGRQ